MKEQEAARRAAAEQCSAKHGQAERQHEQGDGRMPRQSQHSNEEQRTITITAASHHHDPASRRPLLPSPSWSSSRARSSPHRPPLLGDRHVSHRGLNLHEGLAMLRHKLRVPLGRR
ncbi:hypothetical protein V8C26DRAFT_416837 [Trichoderma gracile]